MTHASLTAGQRSVHSALLTPLSSHILTLFLGIRAAIQRGYNQDGREQPGHGDGPQLPSMSIRWPADHLWEHPQGDVLPEDAHRPPGHQFHWRRCVDTVNNWAHLGCRVNSPASPVTHLQSCANTSPIHTAIWMPESSANSLPPPLCECLRGGEGWNFVYCHTSLGAAALISVWITQQFVFTPALLRSVWMANGGELVNRCCGNNAASLCERGYCFCSDHTGNSWGEILTPLTTRGVWKQLGLWTLALTSFLLRDSTYHLRFHCVFDTKINSDGFKVFHFKDCVF